LLRRLHQAAAVAVLVRAPSGPAPGALPDRVGGPAIVMIDPAMSWDDAYHLLRSGLVAAQAGGGTGEALSRVPIGDLFALANAVAAACRGAVAIEDPQRRVLAYSSLPGHQVDETRRKGILDRRVPPDAADEELYRRLVREGGVLSEHTDELPRLAVPVTASGENLGSIWLIAAPGTVSPEAHDILTDAAAVAAVHLLRARAAQDLERRLRSDLVVRLLEGSLSGEHVARRLRFPRTGCAVVALDLGPAQRRSDDEERDGVLDQLADMVTLRLQSLCRGTIAVAHQGAVYALVPLKAETADLLRAPADRVVQDARRALQLPVRAAVGAVVPSLAEAPLGREQVDHLLRVMDRDPSGPAVALVDARRHEVVLQELAEFVRRHPWLLHRSAVAAMTATDARRGTHHAATVAAFLETFGNSEAAARRLHIHPNTLRYRLRRLSETFGVDLMDADTRLVLGLELLELRARDDAPDARAPRRG
jgi:hypothetical protein